MQRVRAHHVHVEHRFAKAPSAIFAYLAEHENLAEVFGAKVKRLRDGDGGERNGVGSVRELQIGPLPAFEETVTEFVVPERIVYRITKGSPLRGHLGVMSFTPGSDGGTDFVYDIRLASPIPGVAAIVRSSLTRTIKNSLAKVDRDA
ncbi:MAG: SRPBCC family protein [Solirubrobacterales bacterium]|nr:SRPBCC family protein [Solirubrobacterales bacterium]